MRPGRVRHESSTYSPIYSSCSPHDDKAAAAHHRYHPVLSGKGGPGNAARYRCVLVTHGWVVVAWGVKGRWKKGDGWVGE